MKNKHFLFSLLGIFSLFLQVFAPAGVTFAASANALTVAAVDTAAGYAAFLSVTNAVPQQNVLFYVKKPDSTVVKIPAVVSANGTAKAELSEGHTKKAGEYLVGVVLANGTKSNVTKLTVYPDVLDTKTSTFKASSTVVKADNKDTATVQVRLTDHYGNPFSSHQVQVISSRSGDVISTQNTSGLTDERGEALFTIASSTKGLSTLSALDVTSNKVLGQRLEIAFVDGHEYGVQAQALQTDIFNTNQPSYVSDAGGFFDLVDVAKAASGSLHHFEFTALPSTIQPNQNVSFKVRALDDGNAVVQNYTGTVHFSTVGANGNSVTLPEDYTFKAEDLGEHTFNLGLSFTTTGTYTIAVADTTTPLLKGEKQVVVGSSSGNQQNAGAQQSQLKPDIESPIAGTYSQKNQIVSGTAPAGLTVKIFDNDQEIGSIQADGQGKFSFNTEALLDGKHKLHVVTLNSLQVVQATSDSVEFMIDSTAPQAEDIAVEPTSNIQPGQVIQLKVTSEENLSQAAAVFNTDIVQLNPNLNEPGTYIASIEAPADPGVYPIDLILVDQLGNEASYKAAGEVTITADGGNASVSETQNNPPENQENPEPVDQKPPEPEPVEPVNQPPTTVSNLIAYASDKKVTLGWDSAQDDAQVKNYKVYYGVNPANLEYSVNTKDASTTWYVPNLDNGKEYYFALTAVDDQGLESLSKSTVISGIPFATEISTLPKPEENTLEDVGGDENLHGAYVENPPKNPGTGPELLWLLSGTGLVSSVVYRLKKKFRR